MRVVETNSPEETWELASELAGELPAGTVIALHGDLGAGKSSFARAFIRALPGIDVGEDVPSPTFTLVQTYESENASVWHFDLYRIEHPQELIELGWDDAVDEGLCLVEWPDKAGTALPHDRIDIEITMGESECERQVLITAQGTLSDEYKDLTLGR